MDFLYPPPDRLGRYRQITSYDRAPMALPIRRFDPWLRKCVTLKPGEPHVAAEVEGAGILTRLFVTFPRFWRPALCREVSLRLYWDGEESPSVESPIGDFFGIHHCRYRQYASRLFSIVSGGIVCEAPMPFARGFRWTLTQDGGCAVPLFFYASGYHELDPGAVPPLRFHAQWRREALVPAGKPYGFLTARGRGYYVGLHLSTQNRDAWFLSPPWQWMIPRGFGLGHLEGWEEIFVDGEAESRHRGTGHEEYFNTGWYFRDGAFTAPDHGCLHRSHGTGRTASYRYHWRAPIPFREGIHAVIHHGICDEIPADYASTAYWYQGEPHDPAYRIPPVSERAVLPACRSRVRW